MEISYSTSTILSTIIKHSQHIAEEARLIEYHSHCVPSQKQADDIEDRLYEIKESLGVIEEWLEYLRDKEN